MYYFHYYISYNHELDLLSTRIDIFTYIVADYTAAVFLLEPVVLEPKHQGVLPCGQLSDECHLRCYNITMRRRTQLTLDSSLISTICLREFRFISVSHPLLRQIVSPRTCRDCAAANLNIKLSHRMGQTCTSCDCVRLDCEDPNAVLSLSENRSRRTKRSRSPLATPSLLPSMPAFRSIKKPATFRQRPSTILLPRDYRWGWRHRSGRDVRSRSRQPKTPCPR